jgi:hypothetical protein
MQVAKGMRQHQREQSAERSAEMPSASLDIFRKDAHGSPIWIDAVQDLADARHRLSQLALVLPGEYFVFDHRTRSIVTSICGQIELDSIT